MTVCRLTHACSQTLINFLLIQNYLWNKGFSGFPGKFFKARFILYWSIGVNVTKILRPCHGTFSKPPNDLCKTAFYHIRNISRIRPCLSIDSTKTLVHVLVMSRWDHHVPKRALRSADQLQLEQPTHKLKLTGLRTFSVCEPYPWNSVPFEIKSSAPVSIFKAKLKTYFFRQAYF